MNQLFQKAVGLSLAAALTLSMAAPAAVATASNEAAAGYGISSSQAVKNLAESASLPAQDWQGVVAFPDWKNYVDDTLAMNSLYSFTGFSGQGELYVTPAAGVTGFRMFVNNVEVDTSAMQAGQTWRVDISGLTLDGTNTIQVSGITPSSLADAVTVNVPYPVVINGDAADVGMDQSTLDMIGDFIKAEVKYGFSGAQLAVVKDGRLVVSEAFGRANGYMVDPSDGTYVPVNPADDTYAPVTTSTLYDLASNTKMYSVNYALQYMLSHDGYDIGLDDPITKFFPEFDDPGQTIFKAGTTEDQKAQIITWKSQLTIRDILMHQAGFDPDPQYHNDKFDQVTQKPDQNVENELFSQDRDTTRRMVLASPLTYEPGSTTKYSDVDYMLLCFVIEKVTGKGLDVFLKETFWDPMGLSHITYNPLDHGFAASQTAATELNGNSRDGAIHFANIREGVIQGTVHDEKAYYAMGGISGHAGLFSNAEDLAKLASLMLTGGYGGEKFFDKNVIDEFIKPKSPDFPTWGLGWWREAEVGRYGYFSTHSSNATVGHQGWTGTLTVIDPENDLVVVLLTNKKNSPVLDNTVNANDFYSDNMVLGALGSVVGYVYESFTSTPDAMDASLMQFAQERIKLMANHKDAYDEAPHMNDAFALTDLVVTRAEKRQSQVTKDYAQTVLNNLESYVSRYVVRQANLDHAAVWLAELQARVDAVPVTAAAPAAPALSAVPVASAPGISATGSYVGGTDQNAVFFPSWASGNSTSACYNNSVTWFDGYQGQGTVYFAVRKSVPSLRIFVNGVEVDTSAMLNLDAPAIFAIDVSSAAVNGRNSVQVTDMPIETGRGGTNAPLLMVVPNPVVVDGTPEQAGLDTKVLDMIGTVIQGDVDRGFTSAQLAVVKDGALVYSNAWGAVNAYNPDGTPKTDSPAVTTDTLYDLASNTKMYATNYALQYLVNTKAVKLTDPITKYFPTFADDTIEIPYAVSQGTGAPDLATAKAWKAELTIGDILRHQAGFAPDPQFHNDKFNQVTQKPDPDTDNVLYAIGKEAVAAAICKAPLVYEPGTKTVYSDVDYMLLGLMIEQVTGKDLDTFLKETFYTPLGLSHITFNPLDHGFTADQIAATELNGNSRDGAISFTGIREGTIQGTVHDEKAYYAMGGVSGHAGLFSNAEDLAKLAQTMLNPSGYGTNRLFSSNINSYFTARKDSLANWGQGWWRQGDGQRPWYFGVQASRNTIGHQGWTGTLTMIDPADDLVVVYLTNKINSPVTDNTVNANQFDGNWYTASTLGFVANILYQGLEGHTAGDDIQPALDALLADMAMDKLRLAADEASADAAHPIVKSAYALVDSVFSAAEARRTGENIAAARAALDSLDQTRDAKMIADLRVRMDRLDPPTPGSPLDAAKAVVEAASYTAAQSEVGTEAAALAKAQALVNALALGDGVTAQLTTVSYTAAVAGTAGTPNGTNGTYVFTVTLSNGTESVTTAALTMTISATVYTDSGDSGDSGSSGGGGGSSGSDTTTNTTTNPDGSKTTTVTDKTTGTVTETTTAPNGVKSETVTKKDGTVTASATLPKDLEGPVTLPVKDLPVGTTVAITSEEPATVVIPLKDNKPGTVAYLVKPDGSREILRKSVTNGDGLTLHLDGSATVVLADNSKSFADMPAGHWAADAVAFATSRELFLGVGNDTFAPTLPMTRAMFATVLYRLENTPKASAPSFGDVPSGTWYSEAVGWASEKGIVTGTGAGFNPDGEISRESLAVMLYRYAGSPDVSGISLGEFPDAGQVSGWAEDAILWATANGIITGKSGGALDPSGSASRAEVATMLLRFVAKL